MSIGGPSRERMGREAMQYEVISGKREVEPEVYEFPGLSEKAFADKIEEIRMALLPVILERFQQNAPCQPETPTWDQFKTRGHMLAGDKRALTVKPADLEVVFVTYFFGILLQYPDQKKLEFYAASDPSDASSRIKLKDKMLMRELITGKSFTLRAAEKVLGPILSGFALCR